MPPVVKRQSPTPYAAPDIPNGVQSAWDSTDHVRMLLYGASGTGKTTLWATFPGPILALVCSGGSRPGEMRSINTPEYRKKINPLIVRDTAAFGGLLEDAGRYKTVVLDHASGLSDLVLKEILGLDAIPAQKSWGLASQQQYGQLALRCKEMFRALLNLPAHVVIVAQERTFGGGDDAGASDVITPTVGPALTPSLAGWLTPACDYVVQTFKRPVLETRTLTVAGKEVEQKVRGKGVEYCLRCEPHDVFMTKFRVPLGHAIPDVIVNPTFGKINAVIRGKG